MNTREALIDVMGGRDSDRPSMDVLLQLTLPIVLILALIMSVEVKDYVAELEEMEAENASLKTQKEAAEAAREALQQELDRSAAGELVRELERMVLTIQQQLLVKAADEIAFEVAAQLGLDDYASTSPAADELVAGQVSQQFRNTTRALARRFNGSRARTGNMSRLRSQTEQRFLKLVDVYLSENSHMNRRAATLRQIDPGNRHFYEAALDGHLEQMRLTAFDVQMAFLTTWLQDPNTNRLLEDRQVGALWQRIQTAEGEELATLMNSFMNLKIRGALDALIEARLEFLTEVRSAAMRTNEP